MPILPMLCPKCNKPMDNFRHYYVNENDKVIEICKECYKERQVHRMCVRVKGKTKVID